MGKNCKTVKMFDFSVLTRQKTVKITVKKYLKTVKKNCKNHKRSII